MDNKNRRKYEGEKETKSNTSKFWPFCHQGKKKKKKKATDTDNWQHAKDETGQGLSKPFHALCVTPRKKHYTTLVFSDFISLLFVAILALTNVKNSAMSFIFLFLISNLVVDE